MLIDYFPSQTRLLTRDFYVAYCLAQIVDQPQEEKTLNTQGEPVIHDALVRLAFLDSNGGLEAAHYCLPLVLPPHRQHTQPISNSQGMNHA